MSGKDRKLEIAKLLACYPSTQGWTAEQTLVTTAAFLDQTSDCSLEALCAACRIVGRRQSAFPPSAGELYAECQKQEAAIAWRGIGARPLNLSKYRLPAPSKRGFTLEQLADWELPINHTSPPYVMRVGPEGNPLKSPYGYPGAGHLVEYGYLTPIEVELVKSGRKAKPEPRKNWHDAG